jgi:diamine N-acetyltransferase
MPEIRPVTKDNWRALIKLQVREDQMYYVSSNVYSIAEAQFGFDYEGHWDLHPFGIYESNDPVGFFMYGFNFEHPQFEAFILRFMVDENYQKKGYGRFGMEKMLAVFRADERIKAVGISYAPENDVARRFYASFGFVEPGRIFDEEVLAVLKLRF